MIERCKTHDSHNRQVQPGLYMLLSCLLYRFGVACGHAVGRQGLLVTNMSFRVTVHAYPCSDGHSKRSEAVQLDIPCGTGEQLVRWLGHAACLKLAYCRRDLMHRYLPHAVMGKDGNILDADHVMKEVDCPKRMPRMLWVKISTMRS